MGRENDGGPAFPLTHDAISHKNRDFEMQGMTLRDYFAAAALTGISTWEKPPAPPYDAARRAYAIADAMLKARQTNNSCEHSSCEHLWRKIPLGTDMVDEVCDKCGVAR